MQACSRASALIFLLTCPLSGCDDTSGSNGADDSTSGAMDQDSGEAETDASSSEGDDGPAPDSDGDGLDDDQEAELGTDPNNKDTDGDTYWDSWEVTEGTDPLSADSRIYTGYWPYNPNKDELNDPGWGSSEVKPEVGGLVPRFAFPDQYGESVDVYDFAGHAESTVIDISAVWCSPCNSIAGWLAGNPNDVQVWGSMFPTTAEKVHSKKIHWITVLGENLTGGNASQTDAQNWFNQYPDEVIPVLADIDKSASNAFFAFGWPTIFIVDPEMKISYFPTQADPWGAMRMIDLYLE